MKNFTYALLLAIVAGLPLRAQVSVGFRGGYTIAAMRFNDPTVGYKNNGIGNTSQLKSWHADVMLDIPLGYGNNLYLQPVLRYVTKGAHLEQPNISPVGVYLTSANKIKLHYLEHALNLVYKVPLSFGKLAAGIGPYVGYSLGGKYDLAVSYNGQVVQHSQQNIGFNSRSNIISTNTQLRRWDAGANFMLGVEFNNLLVLGANYSLGILDLDRSSSSTLKNSYVGLNLGILLSREDY